MFAGPLRQGLRKNIRVRLEPHGRDVDESGLISVCRGTSRADGAGDIAVGEQEVLGDVSIGEDDTLRVNEDAATQDGVRIATDGGVADYVYKRGAERERRSAE